jgi:hypothetical protein
VISSLSIQSRLKEYFEKNAGRVLTLEELQKVAQTTEFTRKIRKLRQEGMHIESCRDNKNLKPGQYMYIPSRSKKPQDAQKEEDVTNQILHLRARIDEITRENLALRKAIGKQEELAQQVIHAIKAAPPPPPWSYKPPHSRKAVTPVLALSDWHIGEIIEPDETEGFGEYNYRIAEQRIFDVVDGFLRWVGVQRSAYNISSCVVLGLGDYVSGDIHRELIATNEFPLPVQTAKAGLLLGEVLHRLSAHFDVVRVMEVGADNHGRLTRKPQSKQKALNNMSFLVHTIANTRVEKCKNVFPVAAWGMKMVTDIGGWKFLLEHGDNYRGWMGIAYYSIARGTGREALKRMNTDKTFHYQCMGHWHVPAFVEGRTLINGSLSGTSEYDHANGRYSEPSQIAFMVHPEHGVFNIVAFKPSVSKR